MLEDIGREADILCLQETKLRRSELLSTPELALADGWEAFFACSSGLKGYSGVATFVRSHVCMPFDAEIGFSKINNHPDEDKKKQNGKPRPIEGQILEHSSCCTRMDTSNNDVVELGLLSDYFSVEELQELDSEGRIVITDHGPFKLYNVYGPALTSEDPQQAAVRMEFKMKFYRALEMWWKYEARSGKAIIAVGDFNIAPAPIDYPDFDPDFYRIGRQDRVWLRNLLATGTHANPTSNFVDCFRAFHPNRKNAFTVWSTATNARALNYGSRIDLCLSCNIRLRTMEDETRLEGGGADDEECEGGQSQSAASSKSFIDSLQEPNNSIEAHGRPTVWISDCNIWPEQQGSDHCPVWVDVGYRGRFPCAVSAPGCAVRFDFGSRKQTSLREWFKQNARSFDPPGPNPQSQGSCQILPAVWSRGKHPTQLHCPTAPTYDLTFDDSEGMTSVSRNGCNEANVYEKERTVGQEAPARDRSAGAVAPKQERAASHRQAKIKTFFRPSDLTEANNSPSDQESGERCRPVGEGTTISSSLTYQESKGKRQNDHPSAYSWFNAEEVAAAETFHHVQRKEAHDAWMKIKEKMIVPKCRHGEPSALKQVGKQGPNKGRWFYTCARPAGKGSEGQCGFFQWVSSSKRSQSSSATSQKKRRGGVAAGDVDQKRLR